MQRPQVLPGSGMREFQMSNLLSLLQLKEPFQAVRGVTVLDSVSLFQLTSENGKTRL